MTTPCFYVWCLLTTTIRLIFRVKLFQTLLDTLNTAIYKAFRVQVLACILKSVKKHYSHHF